MIRLAGLPDRSCSFQVKNVTLILQARVNTHPQHIPVTKLKLALSSVDIFSFLHPNIIITVYWTRTKISLRHRWVGMMCSPLTVCVCVCVCVQVADATTPTREAVRRWGGTCERDSQPASPTPLIGRAREPMRSERVRSTRSARVWVRWVRLVRVCTFLKQVGLPPDEKRAKHERNGSPREGGTEGGHNIYSTVTVDRLYQSFVLPRRSRQALLHLGLSHCSQPGGDRTLTSFSWCLFYIVLWIHFCRISEVRVRLLFVKMFCSSFIQHFCFHMCKWNK